MIYATINEKKHSKIALGCAALGSAISKKDSFSLLEKFFENGGNVLDTARVYASWLKDGDGASEKTIGEFLKRENLRETAVISTKGGHPPLDDMHVSRINQTELTKDLNESLENLSTDYIDIYYLHRDDESKDVSEIMPILDGFVKAGKVKAIGASNWTVKRIIAANKFAKENNLTPFTYSEVMWSYARINKQAVYDDTLVTMDEQEYKGYSEQDLCVMAYSSQAQGLYSIAQQIGWENLSDGQKKLYDNAINRARAEKLMKISKQTSLSPTAIGLNHILHNKLNAIAIVGGDTQELLKDSLSATLLNEQYLMDIDREL